ncbi:MAG TPA: response regulator transcription factor [Gemmatimonadaceae bacterium]|nr:response regulator transcription factor [Gemmatimonadaceae bacterium]
MRDTPPPIRTLVVDDEPLARRGIRRLLAADPEIAVVGDCGDGREAVRLVRELAPELLFLDVQMPEMDGFAVLEALGPTATPAIVFVTAYDQFAVRAFDVHAVDYLLKPFDDERFERALQRAKAHVRRGEIDALGRRLAALLETTRGAPAAGRGEAAGADAPAVRPGREPLTHLLIRVGARTVPLRVDDADWVEAADYYVRFHVGARRYLHRETMASLERRLDPARWVRVHRSAIVNVARVRELSGAARGEVVVLHDGTRLPISRGRRAALAAALQRAR